MDTYFHPGGQCSVTTSVFFVGASLAFLNLISVSVYVFQTNCLLTPCVQVVRESRLRTTALGKKWFADERESNESQTIELLRVREPGESKAKKAKTKDADEHIASFDVVAGIARVTKVWCQVDPAWFTSPSPMPTDFVPTSI